MTKACKWLAAWSAAIRAVEAMAAALAPIAIPECGQPPRLDGVLDDPVWQTPAAVAQLYIENTDTPAPDTAVWLARDTQWLYLGFKCLNSNMAHVVQTVFKHDDLYPNFYGNESVEFYIRPDAAQDLYYWFVLSADNVTFENRISAAKPNLGWNAPWRTAVKRLPDGWTAEIAIPLYALDCDNLGGAQINIVRNRRAVELDQYGAKQGEQTVCSTLAPNTRDRPRTHDFKQFSAVAGLGGFKPEVPFAPRIAAAAAAGFREQTGEYVYDVNLTLTRYTPVAGQVRVKVVEDLGAGDVEKLSELVDMDTRTRELVLSVPAGDLRERRVRVELVDPADGNLLAGMAIEDLSALRVFKKAFAGRSYYTSEENARIHLEFGLPEALARAAELIIEVNSVKQTTIPSVQARMTPEIPVSALNPGANLVKVRLAAAGKELSAKTLVLKRLEPRPGFEVKTDSIKGVILKDGRPFFPVGIYTYPLGLGITTGMSADGEEATFKLLKDVGFNTLVREKAYTNAAMFMQLADKYGMQVVDWMSPNPKPMGYVKWPPPPVTQPLTERLAYQREWYRKLEPELIANAQILREHRNFLAYYNVDEPNLVNPDERIAVAEWYWQTLQGVDPYRPACLVYSYHIPAGDNWTSWGEIVGYDIYPKLFRPAGIRTEPGLCTAYGMYNLRERCRQDNKVVLLVPVANIQDPARTPIGMDKLRMLCQMYVGLIYGAKGLLYFSLANVVGPDAWDALQTICAQVAEFAPALLNGEIAQDIRYTPANFNPAEEKFPMINAAVFQYPDGDYLLLAANIVVHAVEAEFKIGGLQTAARMFAAEGQRGRGAEGQRDKGAEGQRGIELAGEAFKDKIAGYGVRAYRLKLAPAATGAGRETGGIMHPVQVGLKMTALTNEQAAGVDVTGIIAQMRARKNYVPNPCFQRQFLPGVPDFYRPFRTDRDICRQGSDWYVDHTTLWDGNLSLRMHLDPAEKRWMGAGTHGILYPPVSDKPEQMTFSFYAKCDQDGGTISFNLNALFSTPPKFQSGFKLTTEWRRYSVTGSVFPAGAGNLGGRVVSFGPASGLTVWISGLQLEAGETATEFRDDSVR